jgi:hypothetical protein
MVVVSPHSLFSVIPLRRLSASLLVGFFLLGTGASAHAQDPKNKHSKPHAADKRKADEKKKADRRSPAPSEGTVAGTVAASRAAAPAEAKRAQAENVETQEQMATRGPTRLDFDDRLIQGQGNKVGAVYLYDRKNLPLRSMVHQSLNFRDQIVSDTVAGAVIE